MEHRKFLKEVDRELVKTTPGDYKHALFVLHDQLNLEVWPQWVKEEKPLIIFIESFEKGNSLPYHKKKLTYVLSAMRHFALTCHKEGYPVYYHSSKAHYDNALKEILGNDKELELTFMTPSEWDSRERLHDVKQQYPDRVEEIPNSFFFADAGKWKSKIEPGYRMEYFYWEMRRQTGYLMNGEEPEGGEWNYDDQNRESLPKGYDVPEVSGFEPVAITREVMEMVDKWFPDHFGAADNFKYAVTREQALDLLDEFVEERLEDFGPYEDALATDEPILFHTNLSLYLNNGLLLPWEVCDRAVDAYHKGRAPIKLCRRLGPADHRLAGVCTHLL